MGAEDKEAEMLGAAKEKEKEIKELHNELQEMLVENVIALVSGEQFGVQKAMFVLNVDQSLHASVIALLAERGIPYSE
jgi:hypothetical protein